MTEWQVIIRARAAGTITERQLAVISETGRTVSFRSDPGDFTVTDRVDAGTPAAAAAVTEAAFLAACRRVGADVALQESRALTWDAYEAEMRRPGAPNGEIAGMAEAAVMLGVKPARVDQLMKKNAAFPRPLRVLQCGPVWDAAELEDFNRAWERRPGRPRKDASDESPS